jgi:hypothetical protein
MGKNGSGSKCDLFLPEAIIQIRSTWWLIPRIVSGLVHPSYPLLIPSKSLGWTNPLTIRG